MEIPIHYDPMIAKLCAWGANREEAIDRMLRAIAEYRINGVKTTLGFGAFAFNSEPFRSGDFDTKFVDLYFTPDKLDLSSEDEADIAALLANHLMVHQQKNSGVQSTTDKPRSNWQRNRL